MIAWNPLASVHTVHRAEALLGAELEDGEWILKQNGGRLFLAESVFCLDYRPTDVVAFDGNIPHGVTRMKPIDPKDVPKEYKRFSMILFSVCKRTRMRSHGYNR
jgi:hypothetical protein